MDLPGLSTSIMPTPASSAELINQARAQAGPIATNQTAAPGSAAATAAMRRVGEEFESMFLSEMLKPMFEGLQTDELGGGGIGEETFRPMLIDQYAKSISNSGGIGIADAVVRELMRMQTAHAQPAAAATTTPAPPIPITPAATQENDHGHSG